MKNVIFYWGSFDPLHRGHISIMEQAIKKVDAESLYIGLNKTSKKRKLTSYYHRKNMIKEYVNTNSKIKLIPFSFDFDNIDLTYQKIFNMLEEDTNYYILIGEDNLCDLSNWYNYKYLKDNFTFIIAKRKNTNCKKYEVLKEINYIFIDHNYQNTSSTLIRQGVYKYTIPLITQYILGHNIYLKEQIRFYLSAYRYKHTLSVAKTALKINKLANLNIDRYKVERAALLHDIAKDLSNNKQYELMQQYYPSYLDINPEIYHQYLGEHLARDVFFTYDDDILKAIRYHTTGRAKMSLLEKLIYVSDKIEPLRHYDTIKIYKKCINNFNAGFLYALKKNKEYIESKHVINNIDSLNCFSYYIK